jgi:hypothetical protein
MTHQNGRVNLTVLGASMLLAVVCGGWLIMADLRAKQRIALLRQNGTEVNAEVVSSGVVRRKPVLVCRLADGSSVQVPVFSGTRYRRGQSVHIRMLPDPTNDRSIELVDEPVRSIGRGVGISLAVGIVLLGAVLAALS